MKHAPSLTLFALLGAAAVIACGGDDNGGAAGGGGGGSAAGPSGGSGGDSGSAGTGGTSGGAGSAGTGGTGGTPPLPEPTHFDSTPVTWSTPDGGYEGDFGFLTVSGGDYDPGENYYATMDLTGDGLPDLVLTADSGKQFGALGSRHWLVYENTGAGFASSPVTWATPDGGYEGDFGFLTVSGGDYDPGENYYATMDMTGDGRPDLVLTADSGKQYGALGNRHWLVYENTGSGFASTPVTWATPNGGYEGDFGFLTVSGGDYDPGENYYATMDMTGDGRPDLVLTADSGKQYGALGSRHWFVYENTGSGFAASPITWATPDGGYEGDFGFLTVSGGDYDPGENYYATVDMTGDGRPDLVLTADSGKQYGALGSRHWLVYENTGSGFASAPITWATPDGGYEGDFGLLTVSGGDYDPGENYYATMDMTGDGRPDLVFTSESGKQFGAAGNRHWLVYANTGSGFAGTAATWATPDGGYEGDFGFLTVSGGDYDPGENYYATMDMTGDGRPDLVVTSESGKQFGPLGGRYWNVYPSVP